MYIIKTLLCVLIGVILAVLAVQSFLYTTAKQGMTDEQTVLRELMPLELDDFAFELLGVALILGLLYLMLRKSDGKLKGFVTFQNIALVLIFLESIAFIFLVDRMVFWDAQKIYKAAQSDSPLHLNGYFNLNQHQIGMYLYEKLIFTLSFGNELVADALFALINALATTFGFLYLFKISRLIFKEILVTRILVCLSVLALPVIAESWALYGLTFMFPIFTIAFYLLTSYFKTQNADTLLLSALVLGIGTVIKPNVLIGVIAFVIFAIYILFKFRHILAVSGSIALVLCVSLFATPLICSAFQITGPTTSTLAQLAIGTEIRPVTEDKYPIFKKNPNHRIYGFWNGGGGYNHGMPYRKCESSDLEDNREEFYACTNENNQLNKERLLDNFSYIAEHPDEAVNFFFTKQALQWTSPNLGVFVYPTVYCRPDKCWTDDPLKRSLLNQETVYDAFNFVSNAHQLIVYAFAAIGMFALRKKRFITYLLPITFLGGFLFYTISEMKANYAIPFFALLLPVAAYGLFVVFKKARAPFQRVC
ncbi:MAG: glycosyltransferase family 39 protein [Bifidobacteriaceae bacterium]|jgi:hypothetical protein|nr:glycosyltransferase family 39 protein [Bifidobacteriaceae bacterium]